MSGATMRTRPSPNHGARGEPPRIDMLVLHYTGMRSAGAALDRLCDPAARVSAHYLVEEDGAVWRLVPEERRAFHAGVSCWCGERDLNFVSIGVEIANPGHEWGYRPFPEAQMAAVEQLCRDILARHPIPADRVVGHADIAPERKTDPGELFDWPRLARAGIGFWPEDAAAVPVADDIAAVQRRLAAIGYETPTTGALDAATRQVIAAFQRHFCPTRCDGEPDAATRLRLSAVAAACGV